MERTIGRAQLAKMLDVTEEEVNKLSKEHLKYKKDYFMHRQEGFMYTKDAADLLYNLAHPKSDIFLADEKERLWGRVCKGLPPNPRYVWITVDGFDGKQVCNVPPRFKKYREAGRLVPVRHVQDDIFQFAIVDWIDEQNTPA